MFDLKKIKSLIITNKKTSAVIMIAVFLLMYWGYKKITSTQGETRYVTAKVEKGNITTSVSGTGQISDVDQTDVRSKANGDVVYIGATNGQKVSAGALLVQLNSKNAQKSIRDAELSLESSKIALQKLKIQNSNENLYADSTKTFSDAFTTVSNTFLNSNDVLNSLDEILGGNSLSENSARTNGKTAQTYREKAETAYYEASKAFKLNKKNYTLLSNDSSTEDIKSVVTETIQTTELLSDTIKNFVLFVNYMAEDSNNPSEFTSNQTLLSTYTETVSNNLSSLLTASTNINKIRDSFQNSDLDIMSAELTVKQRQNALQDAKDDLGDYFMRAPISGTVANLNLKKSDSVNTGTLAASIVTNRQNALISLNEVDVTKIKIGEPATLTFDAVPELTISGTVTEINPIGTVDQGVVTYDIKIIFDKQDSRIKSGMSVSVTITTDSKENVLTVPNSAIKSVRGKSFVEIFDSMSKIPPERIPVEIGIANDSRTEIISGLNEGDEVVARTISSTTAADTAPSIFGATGGSSRTGGSRPN